MSLVSDTRPPMEGWHRSAAPRFAARRPAVIAPSATHPASEGWRVVAEWDSQLHGGITYGQIADHARPYIDAGDEVHVDLRCDRSTDRLVVATLRVRTLSVLSESDVAHAAAEEWGGA